MKKRGQVTTFIIIGIVLLFLVGTTLFIREFVVERGLFRDIKEPTVIPEQIQAVDYYVDNCIFDVGDEGLDLLGGRGGYIDLSEVETLEVVSDYEVAYWYYNYNGNSFNDYPSKKDLEKRLEGYMESNLEECIANFELLEEQFDIEAGDVFADVDIADNSVVFKVRYPLDINKEGIDYYLANHVIEFDVKLGKMYDMAKTIMDRENEELWLENRTLDVVYIYEGDDIPHNGVEFSCAPKIWNKRDIEREVKEVLSVNVPFYTVTGTDYDVYYRDDEINFWDIGKEYEDLFVDFQFSSRWPFDLDVNPSEGEFVIARPFEGDLKIIEFCTNYMNFFYDIKHPILITVSDGEYNFNFAVDVMIRNDKPRNPEKSPYLDDEYADYCELRDNEIEVYASYADGESLYKNLADASVFYNCINHNCYIGNTDEFGYLKERFPVCGNGVLEVKKEGYQNEEMILTTFDDGESQISIGLEKFVNKKYKVMVYDKVNGNLQGPRELKSDERVMLEIFNLQGQEIKSGNIILYPDDGNISLVPELYNVKGSLVKNSETFIEGKTFEVCKSFEILGICAGGTETVEVEGQKIDELVIGGVELNWLVDRNSLYNSNQIIFYVINQGVPSTFDDLLVSYDAETITGNFADEVMPSYG